MAKVLRRLKIDEVSSVDRGAAMGARVVMFKRDYPGPPVAMLRQRPKFSADAVERIKRAGPAELDWMADQLTGMFPGMARSDAVGHISEVRKVDADLSAVLKGGANMSGSKKMTCPHCGEAFSEDEGEMGKVAKASKVVFDSILDEMMADNKMSKREARAVLGGNGGDDRDAMAKLSALHRAEMAHRLGMARD